MPSDIVEQEAERLAALPVRTARFELNQLIEYAFRLEGIARTAALQVNAMLVSTLRERRVPLWKDDA